MAGLIKLREQLHNKMLVARSIEAILARPHFERLWDDSTLDQQTALRQMVLGVNKDKVLEWIRTHPSICLEEKSMRALFDLAQKYRIKNYSRLQREKLILLIRDAEAQDVA